MMNCESGMEASMHLKGQSRGLLPGFWDARLGGRAEIDTTTELDDALVRHTVAVNARAREELRSQLKAPGRRTPARSHQLQRRREQAS